MVTKRRTESARRISVRDANQGFSRLIAKVERGARFVVTKNKREVARIEPMGTEDGIEEQRKAAAERLKRMMANPRQSTDGWTFRGRREDLHDRSV